MIGKTAKDLAQFDHIHDVVIEKITPLLTVKS